MHTPTRTGNTWNVDPRGDGIYCLGEAQMRHALGELSDDEDEANARLFAAAPALLEALNELLNAPASALSARFTKARAAAEKAIAQATDEPDDIDEEKNEKALAREEREIAEERYAEELERGYVGPRRYDA